MRQELTGFFDLLFKFNATINDTQKELQTIDILFFSRQLVLSPCDFDKALEYLDHIDEWSHRFQSSIRQSIHLPLVVIPLRLPLLMSLLDVQAQVAKLKHLVTLQRDTLLWRMTYRLLCSDLHREGAKPSPDLTSELFCYLPLNYIWYGIIWNSFYLTLEQRHAIQQGLQKLRLHCEEVIEQIDILMESLRYEKHRARFDKHILI